MSSTDELFASLGGSLMKDLWADLQVDTDADDGIVFSLEQLEQELAHLDEGPPSNFQPDAFPTTAASLVVSHQAGLPSSNTTISTTPSSDVWQQSLERFTASSLAQDFLAADSARKATTANQKAPPPGFLDQAEDYNEAAEPLQAPPGLGGLLQPPTIAVKSANSLPEAPRKSAPVESPPEEKTKPKESKPAPPEAATPPAAAKQDPPPQQQVPPPLQQQQPIMIQQVLPFQQLPPPQGVVVGMPVPHLMHSPPMPMGIPVPQMMKPGTPWQTPPVPPPPPSQPQVRVYCHPMAPPFPAAAIESTCMTARDIAYVVHSMLKPILLTPPSPMDYDIQLMRLAGARAPINRYGNSNRGSGKKQPATPQEQTEARMQKTIEWMKEKHTLGHTTKSDVTRPRALLAAPKMATAAKDEDAQQRASLWKARLYIDQGHEALSSLQLVWQAAQPQTIPPQIQPHLRKLFKILGLVVQDQGTYVMDESKNNLQCILKLPKGRTFVARLLEQALLPPAAVQALLPAILTHELPQSPDDATDARLFASMTRVFANLGSWDNESILKCLHAVGTRESLTSQARMECVHALLRRGNGSSPEWKAAEEEFMKLLS